MSAAPTLAPVMPAGQSAEHLKVKLRADLVVQPQFYEGMTHYVIKDPLALKYFRFKIEEYFLLQQFDGKQNLQDVKKAFERKYRPQTISIDDLTRFVAQLHEAGIILIDSPEQAKVLIRAAARTGGGSSGASWPISCSSRYRSSIPSGCSRGCTPIFGGSSPPTSSRPVWA